MGQHIVITGAAGTVAHTVVDALKGLFQQASAIAEQYAKGQMGSAIGFTWYMDQNITTYTAAIPTTAGNAEAARALIKALTAPQAAPIYKAKGLDPA